MEEFSEFIKQLKKKGFSEDVDEEIHWIGQNLEILNNEKLDISRLEDSLNNEKQRLNKMSGLKIASFILGFSFLFSFLFSSFNLTGNIISQSIGESSLNFLGIGLFLLCSITSFSYFRIKAKF
jgi:hypothetical protein